MVGARHRCNADRLVRNRGAWPWVGVERKLSHASRSTATFCRGFLPYFLRDLKRPRMGRGAYDESLLVSARPNGRSLNRTARGKYETKSNDPAERNVRPYRPQRRKSAATRAAHSALLPSRIHADAFIALRIKDERCEGGKEGGDHVKREHSPLAQCVQCSLWQAMRKRSVVATVDVCSCLLGAPGNLV